MTYRRHTAHKAEVWIFYTNKYSCRKLSPAPRDLIEAYIRKVLEQEGQSSEKKARIINHNLY
jgi:hypothetical protein